MYKSPFRVLHLAVRLVLIYAKCLGKPASGFKSSPEASQLQLGECAPPAGAILETSHVLQRVVVFSNDVVF